ncbi:hypothetical protein BH20ACT24_BH20ACT24_20030 [soil metagenome]
MTGGVDVLGRVLQRLGERNLAVVDVGLRRPTLDNVFLSLTGHGAEDLGEPTDESRDGSKPQRSDAREKEAVR